MTLIACVCFYYSKPELLDRLLCSLCGRVDHVILVDGPYEGLSDERYSPPDNYEAINLYKHALSMDVSGGEIWPTEAAKRNAAAASANGDILVIDSDEALLDDVNGFRAVLYQQGNPTCGMRRVYPRGSVWGPGCAVVHGPDGRLLWDHDSTMTADSPWDFRIMHNPESKRKQAEYDAYNRDVRPGLENT